MAKSFVSSVRKVVTNDEDEDDPDSGAFRYVARTIPTNTPFFSSSNSRDGLRPNTADATNSFGTTTAKNKETVNKPPATPSSQYPGEIPSAAEANPGEFNTGLDESALYDHEEGREYEDANDYRSRTGSDGESQSEADVHGVDHYGRLEAEPTRDSQDRLWTEIDALDDVKRLARDVNLYEGFPPGFEQQLAKIRESHAHLLKAMKDRNARIEEERRHEITSRTDSHTNSGDLLNKHTTNSASRIISNAGTSSGSPPNKPSRQINQDYMGATVQADEDKYVQEMIDNITSIRIS